MTLTKSQKARRANQKRNQPKAQQPKPQNQPARQKAKAGGSGGYALSPCALEYARALQNPFTAPPPCLPIFPALPSRKVKCKVRGTFKTGTTGFGFLYYLPGRMLFNNLTAAAAVSNTTYAPIWWSKEDGTYAASNAVVDQTTAGLGIGVSDSDYSSASFAGTEFRLTTAGVRIRQATSKLYQGGMVYAVQQPDHQSLGNFTATNLAAYDECKQDSLAVNDKWLNLIYIPADADDFEYATVGDLGGTTNTTVLQTPFMGIAVVAPSSDAANAQTLEFEAYASFEVVGALARGKTPSYGDPVGFGAVVNARVGDIAAAQPWWGEGDQKVVSLIKAATNILAATYSGYRILNNAWRGQVN